MTGIPSASSVVSTLNRTSADPDGLSSMKKGSHKNVLHQSILDGRLKQLHYFLKMGYNVDAKDKYGRTCLMLAALSDHEDYGKQSLWVPFFESTPSFKNYYLNFSS